VELYLNSPHMLPRQAKAKFYFFHKVLTSALTKAVIKRCRRGGDPPSCIPNASDQPPVIIYTIHKGNWRESSPPWQVNDFRVSSHWGKRSFGLASVWRETYVSGQVWWECSVFLPGPLDLTINMINNHTKLSWLLVRWVLVIPKLEVARAALSVGVSFRRNQ
jgi:hypothetical protein